MKSRGLGRAGVATAVVVVLLLASSATAAPQPPPEESLDDPVDASEPIEEITREELLDHLDTKVEELEGWVASLENAGGSLTGEELTRVRRELVALRGLIRRARRSEPDQAGGAANVELKALSREPAELGAALALESRIAALAQAQVAFAEPEESAFSPILDVLGALQVYGSFRLRYKLKGDENDGFDENTSRVGVQGRVGLGKQVTWFGRSEFGLSFSDLVDFSGDPGSGVDQNDTVPLRLAFTGLETPLGRFSLGRQWSSYYDVAVFTDQLPYLCCEAHGVYAAGTVGEISGTGRASQSIQYRNSFRESIKFSLQGQFRNDTANDRSFADTWGTALVYQWDRRLSLGAAFNRVLDGVPQPEPGQAKQGDEALILGARYRNGRLYGGATYTIFENHETDDLGRYFSGSGLMVVGHYQLVPDRVVVAAEFDELAPESAHPGSYRVRFVTLGGAYFFKDYWSLFALLRLDDGRLSDGARQEDTTLMLTVHYDFSWTPFKRRHSAR